MPPEESLYPQDWFRIGAREIRRARYLLEAEDLEGAAFHIQQALEKYLKGYLLSKGWKLRRIHNLEVLLNEAIVFAPSLEEFRGECQKMTQYYLEERYPALFSESLMFAEIKESLEIAEKMIKRIESLSQ